MKNKIFSLILIICSVFVFFGCANIEYQRITDDTGQILDKFIVELDEQAIRTKMSATKLEDLKINIKNDLDEYVRQINNLLPYLQAKYPDKDFANGIVAKTIPWLSYEDKVCRISIEILYKDSSYLQLLNGSDNEEPEDDNPNEIVKDLFIAKYMMYSNNAFMNMEDSQYYKNYSYKYPEFDVSDVNLTQVYGTTDSRLKSNADYKTSIDGINYHLWEVDTENNGYNTMKMSYYYTTAVGTGWYIVALSLSFALAIILIVVYIIKRIQDRKYKQKIAMDKQIEININGEE